MGNEQKDDCFYMHIQIIGENISNFYYTIKATEKYKSIKDYWKIEKPNENVYSTIEQINEYFNQIEEYKKNDNCKMRESIIVKVPNLKDKTINFILEKMDNLEETYYMPLVLILYENEIENVNKIEIDSDIYENIDSRLIFIQNYSEDYSIIEDKIEPILLRFCSIHNELGDRFTINNKEDYDLINHYFPFNLNIACVGRFGQGKSTGVNAILKEYKAKESSKGCSQTKSLTFYQVNNEPIRVLDIPGFEDEKTVKQAIDKFKFCGERINKIKDNLHIILYFLNFNETRAFMKLEFPMLREILKHKSSKVIYVITHSYPNINEKKKNKVIERINSGIRDIFNTKDLNKTIEEIELDFEIICDENSNNGKSIKKDDNLKIYNMLISTLDNTVFVNFHKDHNNGNEPFGTDLLFKKIHQFFTESEDYKNSTIKLDSKMIEKRALKLRAQAQDVILSNKIWGGAVGVIPGVDWILQKFVIKKNAAKKIGRIFGIDVKFVDEEQNKNSSKKKETNIETNKETNIETNKETNIEIKEEKIKEKNKEKKKKKKEEKEGIINSSYDKDTLKLEIEGAKLTNESSQYKIGNSIKITTEAGAYIGSGVSFGSGVARASAEAAVETAAFGLKVVGSSLAIAGVLIGVGLGGYFTNKYCEELLDKFVEYYKKNAEKIDNSYQKAANYFLLEDKND